MYDSYKPDNFRRYENDNQAIRWYFKHLFTSQGMPLSIGLEKYSLFLTAYRDKHKIEGEFSTEQWKGFVTYFAEKMGFNGHTEKIRDNIIEILNVRHPTEEPLLEDVAEEHATKAKPHASAEPAYLPLALMGCCK